MRNPHGYLTIIEPGKPIVEHDTVTCCHCNRVTVIKHGCKPDELGGFCQLCMGYTCPECAKEGTCSPFEKKLEQMESEGRRKREVAGWLSS